MIISWMTYNKKNAAIFETSIGIFSPEKNYYQSTTEDSNIS